MDDPTPRSSAWRRLADVVTVVVSTLAFSATIVGICALFVTGNRPNGRDVVSYWVAGSQLLHHANPYDAATVLRIERNAGFPADDQALIMRNPPTALPLVLPLGLLGLRAAALLWSVLLVACFVVSVQMLWVMCGRPRNKLHLLGYTFGPALTCIFAGQTALFVLLGLVLFLRFHRARPYMAGAALWLCALKPHLFIPFAVVLLLWLIANREYRIIVGFAATLLASAVLAARMDPSVWTQYAHLMRDPGIQHEFIPCLSVALGVVLHAQAMWVRYVPALVAAVWASLYYWKHRGAWNWLQHGSLLMLVSILASPYAWLSDQTLVLPAIMLGVYRTTSFGVLEVLALASAAIEIELLFGVSLHSALFLWAAPFWLVWYLCAGAFVSIGPAR